MKISKIILKGVNNFEDFTYSFEDNWAKTIPDALLLIGPNGCGKTTLLRSIGNLWAILGGFLERLPYMVLTNRFVEPGKYDGTFRAGDPLNSLVIQRANIFAESPLAAMEINDFVPGMANPLWVYIGNDAEVSHFCQTCQHAHTIGGKRTTGDERNHVTINYQPPATGPNAAVASQQWIENIRERFIKNRMGGSADLANLIFLESETRTLPQIEEAYRVMPEKEDFNWLALYNADNRREGSLQNYLFTLKAINPEKYDRTIAAMNAFLADKQISGFDQTTADLMITTKSGKTHPIHLLSSGERQILLILAFIARELRPGGIVLIDEPDLHLHVSLSNAFVSHLKQWVAAQGGQLIMASHSPQLWERFTQAERVELGSLEDVA